jgi:hypothetical protein
VLDIFHVTRLLGHLAIVIRTCGQLVSGRFLIMAMAMEQLKVVEGILTTSSQWDNVIHFHQISFSKVQPTLPAFSLLFLQKFANLC